MADIFLYLALFLITSLISFFIFIPFTLIINYIISIRRGVSYKLGLKKAVVVTYACCVINAQRVLEQENLKKRKAQRTTTSQSVVISKNDNLKKHGPQSKTETEENPYLKIALENPEKYRIEENPLKNEINNEIVKDLARRTDIESADNLKKITLNDLAKNIDIESTDNLKQYNFDDLVERLEIDQANKPRVVASTLPSSREIEDFLVGSVMILNICIFVFILIMVLNNFFKIKPNLLWEKYNLKNASFFYFFFTLFVTVEALFFSRDGPSSWEEFILFFFICMSTLGFYLMTLRRNMIQKMVELFRAYKAFRVWCFCSVSWYVFLRLNLYFRDTEYLDNYLGDRLFPFSDYRILLFDTILPPFILGGLYILYIKIIKNDSD